MAALIVDHPDMLISKYRCGACWDVLVEHFADERGKYKITCVHCGEFIPGLVSLAYVERRQAESYSQYIQARAALKNAWPFLFPNSHHSIEQNMEALGFKEIR